MKFVFVYLASRNDSFRNFHYHLSKKGQETSGKIHGKQIVRRRLAQCTIPLTCLQYLEGFVSARMRSQLHLDTPLQVSPFYPICLALTDTTKLLLNQRKSIKLVKCNALRINVFLGENVNVNIPSFAFDPVILRLPPSIPANSARCVLSHAPSRCHVDPRMNI